jgi:hypothetical protein
VPCQSQPTAMHDRDLIALILTTGYRGVISHRPCATQYSLSFHRGQSTCGRRLDGNTRSNPRHRVGCQPKYLYESQNPRHNKDSERVYRRAWTFNVSPSDTYKLFRPGSCLQAVLAHKPALGAIAKHVCKY